MERETCQSAQDLHLMVGKYVEMMQNNGHVVKDDVPRRCQVCRVGFYPREKFERGHPRINPNQTGLRFWSGGSSDVATLPVRVLACDTCGHLQMFSGTSPA